MKNTKKLIQKELKDHIKSLNTDFKDQYGEELNVQKGEKVSDAIDFADIDSIDFNIGFEQGFMRGLEVALSKFK